MMKISLFIKSSMVKSCFSFLLAIAIVGMPNQANAGFFSDIVTRVLGNDTQASEIPTIDPTAPVHNSQTVPLFESSVNPDVKNIKYEEASPIVEDEALSTDTAPLDSDSINKQYVSSAEITTYTVKKGDTIGKISMQFGISKNTIIQANEDLGSKGIVKIGQVLTILPVDGLVYTVKRGDTISGLAQKYNATTKDILSYNDIVKASDIKIGDTIVIPGSDASAVAEKLEKAKTAEVPSKKEPDIVIDIPSTPVDKSVPSIAETPTDKTPATSQVSSGGYIWPVPQGTGRISQRLHDDNAVDLAAPKGTPIYAPKDGTVLIADGAGYNGGYGLYVVINFTDKGQMLFGHMSKVIASAGDTVKQGDIIGLVGTTGKSTGNHIHLSARGGIKNPYGFLMKNDTSSDFQ